MCQHAWRELVRSSFRSTYRFPENASHNWFPGHMHKGLRSMQRKMRDVDCVIEVHDARIPFSGRNLTFREVVGGARPHILVLNKADLVPDKDLAAIRKESMRQSPHISEVLFTDCRVPKCPQTAAILPTVSRLIGEEDRYQRRERPDSTLLVVGIPNVGKSSLINRLRSDHLQVGGRPAPVGAKPGWTRSQSERIRISDRPLMYLLDTPGISVPFIRNMHIGMKLAVCATLKDELVGVANIADYLLWWLNTNANFSYVSHMGLSIPEDRGPIMLAKAAIALGFTRKVRDVSKGMAHRVIPDIDRAGGRFLKGFRDGHYGKVNLDCDHTERLTRVVARRAQGHRDASD